MPYKRLIFEIGTKIGLLEIVEVLPDKNYRSNFLCRCTCGNLKEVLGKNLNRALKEKKGGVKSCGCLVPLIAQCHTVCDEDDLSGRKFDLLTVIQRDFSKLGFNKHTSYYECLCDCGNYKSVKRSCLIDEKRRRSCGCLLNKARENFLKKFCKFKTEEPSEKVCKKCKNLLDSQEFDFQKRNNIGIELKRNVCRKCRNKQRKSWYARKVLNKK